MVRNTSGRISVSMGVVEDASVVDSGACSPVLQVL